MLEFEQKVFEPEISLKEKFLLIADIGGTKTRFALASVQKKKPRLILSLIVKSSSVKNFEDVINRVLRYLKNKYDTTVTQACFAAAGKVSTDRKFVEITNLKINLDAKKIVQKTTLKSVIILNDFEAAAYGLESLGKKDFLCLNCSVAKSAKKGTKVIIGAGTGLGQSFLMWQEHEKRYIPHPSEGGHADFAVQNQEELDLINFVRKDNKPSPRLRPTRKQNTQVCVEWEDLLSGNGISKIYKFLEKRADYKISRETLKIKKGKYSPVLISKYKNSDELAKKTFEVFARFYARYAKSFALQALATGGIYFVGSIAVENLEMFKHDFFLNEFVNSYKMSLFLKSIPIFVVTDANVGLYGAAVYAKLMFNR